MDEWIPGGTQAGPGVASAACGRVAAGIVAYNDEHRIERSIRSLLSQELPAGAEWGRVWVVASGCTDRTVEVASSLADADPRIELIVQRERRGKAAALREVLRRAEGEYLVLLNSDAVAAPGSVSALLTQAHGKPRPFAVMARPVVPAGANDAWTDTMRWMWDLHHELHCEMLGNGRGAHLSDEMFLVSLPAFPWIEDGIINDGSYCAVWLQNHAGGCWYAPEARVAVDVPQTPSDHLRQRRRIHVGNAQVASRLGRPPTTAVRYFFENPARALGALRRSVASPLGARHLLKVLGWEAVAHALGAWDRVPPRRDHVRWSRIASSSRVASAVSTQLPAREESEEAAVRRVRVLLDVAREFRTGIPLPRLAELLPNSRRWSENELTEFLAGHPELGRLRDLQVLPAGSPAEPDPERTERGLRYHRAAEVLVRERLAALHRWVRCIGVTGSAAFGAPSAGDDLDFYVVTRKGSASWFLLTTYLTLRLAKIRHSRAVEPTPCFNYVVDDRRAPLEFARGRGLLFAREALTARILLGDDYYRGLLAQSEWLGSEIPPLFALRTVDPGDTKSDPAPVWMRCLNALAFLPLATYLQLAGLVRNARARSTGQRSTVFRTLTAPDGFIFQSQRFEELRRRYETPTDRPAAYAATGSTSRVPLLR